MHRPRPARWGITLRLPARLVRHARVRVLKISLTWPWKEAFLACWQRLRGVVDQDIDAARLVADLTDAVAHCCIVTDVQRDMLHRCAVVRCRSRNRRTCSDCLLEPNYYVRFFLLDFNIDQCSDLYASPVPTTSNKFSSINLGSHRMYKISAADIFPQRVR